ncbi:MAG TPA: ion channel [Gaiellaceae bacterium]|nr:ion channel [Gaiellaceae bacterium]
MDERSRRIERAFEIPMIVAALLVIPVIAVEQSNAGDPWREIAAVTNWAIWIAFATELVVMLAVVPDRWGWARSHLLEVIVVVLTPPFAPSSLQAVRALRLLRLLRLLRVARYARRVFTLDGVRYAAILAALTAVGGGYVFSAAEQNNSHGAPSAWDGVWWAITTMTTVGYGDFFPESTLGRIVAIALMLVGIGFIAILTGAIAERFLATEIEEAVEAVEEVEATEGEVLAELREIRSRLDRLETRLG